MSKHPTYLDKKARAERAGLFVGILTYVFMGVIIPLLYSRLQLEGSARNIRSWQILSWVIALSAVFYYRMMRVDKYIIWLRRFHNCEPTRLRFDILLDKACLGICVPITIQDSTFRMSDFASQVRVGFFRPIMLFLGLFIYVLFVLPINNIIIKSGMVYELLFNPSFLIGGILIIPYYLGAKKFMERQGYTVLKTGNGVDKFESRLRKIAARKKMIPGIMVFKCPDEIWQQVVGIGIERASAVIIDVSELTGNVAWELKKSLERSPLTSIILTVGVQAGVTKELPYNVRAILKWNLPIEKIRQLRVFYYPAEQPPPGKSRSYLYKKLTKCLSRELSCLLED